jgi:hypothetical protein
MAQLKAWAGLNHRARYPLVVSASVLPQVFAEWLTAARSDLFAAFPEALTGSVPASWCRESPAVRAVA